MKRKNFRMKWVGRYDEIQGHLRLFRIMWETGTPGDGKAGHSNMISVAVQRKLLSLNVRPGSACIIILGIRVHRKISYGGIFA